MDNEEQCYVMIAEMMKKAVRSFDSLDSEELAKGLQVFEDNSFGIELEVAADGTPIPMRIRIACVTTDVRGE